MKKLIIPLIILFAIIVLLIANETILLKANTGDYPGFNIRVMQTGNTTYQNGAQVIYKQGGTTIETGTTSGLGWYYTTLPTGTYDVYVYYPPQPNDAQAGSLLGYYHSTVDNITITLGGVY
jgi:hypothetical protein